MNKRWEFIAELINMHDLKTGVELGVAEGRFTHFLLKHTKIEHMYAVDLWDAGVSNAHESYEDWPMDMYLECLQKSLVPYKDRVSLLRMTTTKALEYVPEEVDFVFVDADHSFEGASEDIKNWKDRAKVFISGHDINLDSVQIAVMTNLENYETGPNKVWISWK